MNRTNHNTTRTATPAGFSLVEVLMAVLILGLGLLGLGAIMPAVVKQQRVGTDQTFGTLASRSVGALVKGNAFFSQPNPSSGNILLKTYGRWEAWARCLNNTYSYTIPQDGSWLPLAVDGGDSAGLGQAEIGPRTGPGIVATVDQAYINLADRIVPSLSSLTSGSGLTVEPQFIVDAAVRRVTPIEASQVIGTQLVEERPGNFTVQMVLFTRRIDQRARPVGGVSLMQAIADVSTRPGDRLWPVSEDNNGNPTGGGENSGAGNPRYSLPYTVNVAFDPAVPDRLTVISADDSALLSNGTPRTPQTAFLQSSIVNQIVVDNLGNIYTVQGADDRVSGQLSFRISPSVPAGTPGSGSADPRRLHQIILSPQIPAAVNIITVNP